MTITKNIEKIKEWVILGTIFLFPLVVSNAFIDQVQLPKLILLATGICITLVIIAVEIFINGKTFFAKSKFDLPILFIVIAYLASAFIETPNKVEAFFAPGTALFIVGFGILYFLTNMIEDKKKVKLALIGSAATLSLITLTSFIGVFDKIGGIPTVVKAVSFNPTGDFLTASAILVISLILGADLLIKEKAIANKLIMAGLISFIFIGLGISIFSLTDPKKTNLSALPPFDASWDVAIETIKQSPILGTGPGNYLTAFGKFIPVTYNSSSLWQVRFGAGRSFYLTVITETGILGGIAIVFLIFTIIKTIEKSVSIYKESRTLHLDLFLTGSLLAILAYFLVFPSSPATLMILFILIALSSKATRQNINFGTSGTIKTLAGLTIIAAVGYFLVQSKPVVSAENIFKQAGDALNANNGKQTYALLGQAINFNPYVDRYHASYAQVNLAIARSILSSEKDPKNIPDADKTTITTLIQQAIREGQSTVALNPQRSANWELLGNVYQAIIPFAAQADSFAIQSYTQAINLDPTNPNLRLELGQLYFALGNYDDAANTLQLAVFAKSDLPNTHYNLALAYANNKQFDKAITEMQTVLNLTKKDSPDYKTAQDALTNLQKQKSAATPANGNTGSTLNAPQKLTTEVNPPISLPKSASPPAAIATPSPAPSISPTP